MDSAFGTETRSYIDFRQLTYPELGTGTPTYTSMTAGDNKTGSHLLTGGYGEYFFDLASTLTVRAVFKPNFAWDIATDQWLLSWRVSGTQALTIGYDATADVLTVQWVDGGTSRALVSSAYTAGAPLSGWYVLDATLDLRTSQTGGSALYVGRVSQDTAWSGAIDAKSTSFPLAQIRAHNGTAGDYKIASVQVWPSFLASAAQVAADYKDVRDEQVVWHFNGHPTGRTRCDVSDRVVSFGVDKRVEDDKRRAVSNSCRLSLISTQGEFADDQFAAWDPANAVYYGTDTVDQRYLQHRCRVEVETWYGNDVDLLFVGRLDDSKFRRRSAHGQVSEVEIVAHDPFRDLAAMRVGRPTVYDDYKLSDDSNQAASLLHTVARLTTKPIVKNFVANSGFENGTIAHSWEVSGTGASLARVSGGILGSFQGDLVTAGATAQCKQTVTFTDDRKLSVGETYTWSVYLKSTAAASVEVNLQERDASGNNGQTSTAATLTAGGNWKRYSVTRTLTDGDSDRLMAIVQLATTTTTLSIDAAMLTQSSRARDWFVLNNNDGVSAVESADDADSAGYETIGFDADTVDITHSYARLYSDESPAEVLSMIGDATLALYAGADSNGTYFFRSRLKTGYSDQASLATLAAPSSFRSSLDERQANKIVVQGMRVVEKTKDRAVIWHAVWSGDFDTSSGALGATIADGATWPPEATFGTYWASAGGRRPDPWSWYHAYGMSVNDGQYLLGVKNAEIQFETEGAEALVQTTTLAGEAWDARAAEFLIQLTNSTGSSVVLNHVMITGYPVWGHWGTDRGIIHDAFADGDDIERNGELRLDVANPYIVTKSQAESVADYWRKYAMAKKHVYECSYPGALHWIEPGNSYTLTFGGAGTEENVSSVVEAIEVQASQRQSNLGETRVVFREMERNWTKDSDAVARFVAGGDVTRLQSGIHQIAIGASTSVVAADSYCDGTADEVQINAALTAASAHSGIVSLVDGTYYLAAPIVGKAGATLALSPGAVLEKNGNFSAITVTGTSGSEVEKFKLTGGTITRASADTNDVALLDGDFADNLKIDNVFFKDPYGSAIKLNDCDGLSVSDVRCSLETAALSGSPTLELGDCSGYVASLEVWGTVALTTAIEAVKFYGGDGLTLGPNVNIRDIQAIGNLSVVGLVDYSIGGATITTSGAQLTGGSIHDLYSSGGIVNGIRVKHASAIKGSRIRGFSVYSCRSGRTSAATSHWGTGIAVETDDLVAEDCEVSDCDTGIYTASSADRTILRGNDVRNSGQLIEWSGCEGDSTATPSEAPLLLDDTAPAVSPANCTFVRSTAQVRRGVYSYLCTKLSAASAGAAEASMIDVASTTDLHGLLPGGRYYFGGHLYVPAGTTPAHVSLTVQHYSPSAWTTVRAVATVNDAWELCALTVTLPTTATGVQVFMEILTAADAGDLAYVDDLVLREQENGNEHEGNFLDGGTGTLLLS